MIETTTTNENRFSYPVALNLWQRKCVVVGGGMVGARKATALAEAGATVVFVAPKLAPEAETLVGLGKAQHLAETFRPAHLNGAFLVIVATDNPIVNADVAQVAAARNILANLAAPGDDADTGDFATMATVKRGDLLLAVTCGGAGPSLSAGIRRELAERFGPEWEPLVALFGDFRQSAKQLLPDTKERTAALRRLAEQAEPLAALIKNGQTERAREEAWACLQP